MLLKVLLIAVLLFVFYQDMRYRAVSWIAFPFLLIVLIVLSIQEQSFYSLVINSGINMAFLLIQFLLLFVYFSLKERGLVNITSGYLGWGDILFLICIAFYFSPASYLFFYILSLIIVLIVTGINLSIYRNKEIKIPLAGIQSILFAIALLADWQMKPIDFTNDYWLLNYLN